MKKYKRLEELVNIRSGSPQFRIDETTDQSAPVYNFYGQSEIYEDLSGISSMNDDVQKKIIRTFDRVMTLNEGDLVFSLISGTASIVSGKNKGYMCTQNYLVLNPNEKVDSKYLIYLLNEDKSIQRQLQMGLQGSTVLKYSIKQVRELRIVKLPGLHIQKIIGDIYLKQLKLSALKKRVIEYEKIMLMEKLRTYK